MKSKNESVTNINIRVTTGENEALEGIARTSETHLIEVFVDGTLVFIEKSILSPDVPPTSTGVAETRITADQVRREVENALQEILNC